MISFLLFLILLAFGFFIMGFYYCRWRTLCRLEKFVGKGNLPYLTVLEIIANDLPKKDIP